MTETVFMLLKIEVGKEAGIKEKLAACDAVKQADLVTGPYDVLVRVEGSDMKDIGKILVGYIRQIDGIVDTLTMSVVG